MYRVGVSVFVAALLALVLSGCGIKDRKVILGSHIPKGWYVSSSNVKIKFQKLQEKSTGYKIDFDRSWKNEEEKYYITLAESLYPERELIDTARNSMGNPPKTKSAWYFERLWWASVHDGKKLPFALTSEAVLEYLGHYKEFRKEVIKKRKNLNIIGDNRNRIDFAYKAKVFKTEKSVRVWLSMRWYQYCGLPCGWGFEKTRVVTFANRSHITGVKGDEVVKLWVSSDEDPYGKEWFTF